MRVTYCYTVPGGITVDRDFERGEAPPTVVLDDGLVAERDFQAEHSPRRRSGDAAWPIECIGSGVNASQAGELREFLKRKGVPTEVTRDGNPVYRDMHHRRRALAARDLHSRNEFY